MGLCENLFYELEILIKADGCSPDGRVVLLGGEWYGNSVAWKEALKACRWKDNEALISTGEESLIKYRSDDRGVSHEQRNKHKQRRDPALTYILTSFHSSWKAMIWQTRCPRVAWNTLKETIKSVSEAPIGFKHTQLQAEVLLKGERIEYSSRTLGLVAVLDNAGHAVS